jgi:hypothetical protein
LNIILSHHKHDHVLDFCNTYWKKWYEAQLPKIQVNSAITDKLVGSHTAMRKKAMAKKKTVSTTGAAAHGGADDGEEVFRELTSGSGLNYGDADNDALTSDVDI